VTKKKSGITVIDLFCGAGGFSEGFHMAGYDVVYGIDNWNPACETHTFNGLGETEKIELLLSG
jgi:DNA (cytosine-5)-methyltransferase 1